MNFVYNLPVNLIFGRGSSDKVGQTAALYGTNALIVTGGSSSKKSGLLDKAIELLGKAGLKTTVFDKVKQNPWTTTAHEGAAVARENGCDVVVALGGGSIMDCAKAIAFLSVNEGDVSDYIYGRKSSDRALPLVLVPTTCGTGSEGNGFAVLTNPENGDKKSLRSNAIIAKASIIDSSLMQTMPKHILSSVAFDALCHSMEAYVSKIAQPLTDYMSVAAMKLIGENLVNVYEGDTSADAWDAITWASTIGGMVINTAGVVITEASIDGNETKYATISRLLGGNGSTDCADTIRKLLEKIDLNVTLSQQGIEDSDIPWMTKNCFKVSVASIANHPVTFNEDQVAALYEKAL